MSAPYPGGFSNGMMQQPQADPANPDDPDGSGPPSYYNDNESLNPNMIVAQYKTESRVR